jgi:hypothetical protein
MNGTRLALAAAVLIGLAMTFAAPSALADGTTIEYQATNISGNEWQYTYTLTGTALGVNQGFTVFFDFNSTSSLNDTSTDATNPTSLAATNWLSFVLQGSGSGALSSDGVYTALSLTGASGSSDSFTVLFDYLGSGAPGSQAFSIDQYDSFGDLISNVQTGQTVPFTSTSAVPEPGSGLLLALGVAVLLGVVLRAR